MRMQRTLRAGPSRIRPALALAALLVGVSSPAATAEPSVNGLRQDLPKPFAGATALRSTVSALP
jgi:hypothetical protein